MKRPEPLHFDEARHLYSVDGVGLPGVTAVIRSALGDPFSRIQPAVLERKRRVGNAAHAACYLDAIGCLDETTVVPAIRPYLDAWRRFRSELPFRVVASEQPLYSKTHWFAGRPDFYVLLLQDIHSGCAVVDVKTGLPGFGAGLQLAAYRMLLEEEYGLDNATLRRFTLQLKDSGKYSFVELKDHADTRNFLACLAVHRMKEKTKWAQR